MRPCTLFLALALALPLALPASAQTAAQPAAAPPAVAAKAPLPLLWKVSDKDNSVYLLGSFHLLGAEDAADDADVDAAFADAESLMFEINPAEMADIPAMTKAMQSVAGYAPGHSYQSVMPAPLREKLEAMTKAAGQDPATLAQSEPWQLSLGMMLGITQSMGFKPEYGLDKRFMARAAKAGKPVAGLETFADQLTALDGTPYPEQVAGLQEFLDAPQKTVQQMRDLHTAWRKADVATIDKDMGQEMARKTPQTYKRLLTDRNNAWLPQLQARLDKPGTDDTLVVVGAMHLIGKDGVVDALRAKGYTVERICSRCTPPMKPKGAAAPKAKAKAAPKAKRKG